MKEAIFEIEESCKSVSIIKHYRSFIDNIKQQKRSWNATTWYALVCGKNPGILLKSNNNKWILLAQQSGFGLFSELVPLLKEEKSRPKHTIVMAW